MDKDDMLSLGVFRPLTLKRIDRTNTKALNRLTFIDYFNRLQELAMTMFEWENLPPTVDVRFLEMVLCEYGQAVFFKDEILGYLGLTCAISGELDVYRIPIRRRAYATNGYQLDLTIDNSVLIFNNYLHKPSLSTLELFASRLTEIERTIDVNVRAQKTPVAILCDEFERLTVKNIYAQYDGNEPVIIGSKNMDTNNFKAFPTLAPYVADKLNILKRQIWSEALTFLGIENNSSDKKERLVSEEVQSSMGAVNAQRNVMLNARRQACEQINAMFGLNVSVKFREQELTEEQKLLLEDDNDYEGEEESGGADG